MRFHENDHYQFDLFELSNIENVISNTENFAKKKLSSQFAKNFNEENFRDAF